MGLQGHYAGFVSRAGSFFIDLFVIAVAFSLAGTVLEYIVSAATGNDFSVSDYPVVANIALLAWAFFYCAYSLALDGKTLGMALIGVRAVRRDGSPIGGWQAVLRVLVFPLSFLVFCLGFIMILLGRERRALHDVIAGTAVVYGWDAAPPGCASWPSTPRPASEPPGALPGHGGRISFRFGG